MGKVSRAVLRVSPVLSPRRFLLTLLVMLAPLSSALAVPVLPEGRKVVTLYSQSGEPQVVGHVTFVRTGDGATFDVKMDAPEFQEQFLSMRPFQCVAGVKETWCYLAYPYDLQRQISATDFVDLEYSLLFLFKSPASYGIDPWNGLYFKLALSDDGSISGVVHDVNLNPLGVPPKDRSARTIVPSDLTASAPASHRFARIEIK